MDELRPRVCTDTKVHARSTITNAQEAVKLYVYDTGLFSLTQSTCAVSHFSVAL